MNQPSLRKIGTSFANSYLRLEVSEPPFFILYYSSIDVVNEGELHKMHVKKNQTAKNSMVIAGYIHVLQDMDFQWN